MFHLSKEGTKTIIKAAVWLSLFQLATLLPVIPLARVSEQMMTCYFKGQQEKIPFLPYVGVLLLIVILMFVTYKVAYHKEYLTAGQEEYNLRMELADKLRRLPLSFFGRRELSDLTSVIMDDVQTVSHILSQTAAELMSGLITGCVAMVVLFFYDARLTCYLAICLPVAVFVMALSRRISEGTNKKNRGKKLAVSDGLQEYLENIKLLRTTERIASYQKELERKIKNTIPGQVLYELLAGLSISISYNVMRIGLGLVILFGSKMLVEGDISLFKFLVFLYAAVRIYEPFSSACEHLGDFIASLVGAGRVNALLLEEEQDGADDVAFSRFDITFDHVSFAYNEKEVLHDVSFIAKQGEITALVGPSGSGKSTLTRLAARFWDVKDGAVLVGGKDVKKIAPEKLLANYSIVFQDVVLFNDTIYNNIRIGKAGATEEEVYAAARLAACDEFIERLPDGYQTMIGENGKTLSGGERQRLSIARAFLKDAPVVLLDESTASIDPENETKIQQAIGKLIENKTVLIIAHKLRSVVDCDKIVVLNEGGLAEEGTHETLMAEKGLYHRLYTLQNESLAWKVNARGVENTYE